GSPARHHEGGQGALDGRREIWPAAAPAPGPRVSARGAHQRLSILNRHQCIPWDASGSVGGQGASGRARGREPALHRPRAGRAPLRGGDDDHGRESDGGPLRTDPRPLLPDGDRRAHRGRGPRELSQQVQRRPRHRSPGVLYAQITPKITEQTHRQPHEQFERLVRRRRLRQHASPENYDRRRPLNILVEVKSTRIVADENFALTASVNPFNRLAVTPVPPVSWRARAYDRCTPPQTRRREHIQSDCRDDIQGAARHAKALAGSDWEKVFPLTPARVE